MLNLLAAEEKYRLKLVPALEHKIELRDAQYQGLIDVEDINSRLMGTLQESWDSAEQRLLQERLEAGKWYRAPAFWYALGVGSALGLVLAASLSG